MGPTLDYSIPLESERLLKNGILLNALHKDLPTEAVEYGSLVRFEGSNHPSIPINWRFAESVASLKGFESVMVNVILKRKYGVEPGQVVINTYLLPQVLQTCLLHIVGIMPNCFSCQLFLSRSIRSLGALLSQPRCGSLQRSTHGHFQNKIYIIWHRRHIAEQLQTFTKLETVNTFIFMVSEILLLLLE